MNNTTKEVQKMDQALIQPKRKDKVNTEPVSSSQASIDPGNQVDPNNQSRIDLSHTAQAGKRQEEKDQQVTGQRESKPHTEESIQKLEKQVNLLEELVYQSHMRDIAYHFTNKKAIIGVNLLAGLARGIGLTLGTALFLAFLFYILNTIVSIPIIGEYIASWLDIIEEYRQFNHFDMYSD